MRDIDWPKALAGLRLPVTWAIWGIIFGVGYAWYRLEVMLQQDYGFSLETAELIALLIVMAGGGVVFLVILGWIRLRAAIGRNA